MREMEPLSELRKIVLVVTDGEPDSLDEANVAIAVAKRLRLEVYGLGLGAQSVKGLFPGRSVVLSNLADLPGRLFWLLGRAMDND
jgi:hypothetical protein